MFGRATITLGIGPHSSFFTVSRPVHFPLCVFAVQSEHSHRRHRSAVQSSTKHDCPAVAVIREICWFPGHKVTHMLSC